ncbi:MAG: prepilin-type N-terminal cleavage/methylation domain-containing protein [Nitrospinota bacterium]|nr:MAG: prepilin-type N-terminal cleavage/methylation domain-containing protein [Nitrospinota bacterium]
MGNRGRRREEVAVKRILWHSADGFSLIEVTIALVVIALGVAGMVSIVSQSFRTKRLAHDITQATLLAQERLEYLSLLPGQWGEETALQPFRDEEGRPIAPRFRWRAEAEQEEDGKRIIRVWVYWPWPHVRHQLRFTTYAQAF